MVRKKDKEYVAEQQLPKLGIKPYLELMNKTAFEDTDRYAAYIGLLMLWTSDNVLDAVDIDLSPYGITESKLDLLLLLTLHEKNGNVSPSAIAERLGIRRASVTALLDWVEKRGWIVREHSAKDRRMVHVKITSEGRVLVEQVLPHFWSSCESLVNELEPEEQRVFEKVLVKLHEKIEKRLGVGR
ncbi:MarR family winged helix-turn-helix transcriptional regulator [Aneurinibacillus migulanus]|uniref:Transcriptional regulator n=1 Tax=Aneurinibacillus migulanus TaxID=47500 RepID=A0A0D1XPB3_ANEMI|nr:MarR family transcriptional regulator [Aneurinibacillus migulanus]KIV54043.1 transcriptional regulator [Aneurinibacillus migulanus]KON97715.1 transcriptional regulator [Aneurinibacillus migulanus]MED0896663.1 MarR family transcriptional regulator [Aneurinibacillus migulanus]MED1619867.1 MarR family transcriptional regulator [Aneurinibacillus migulanus]SDK59159.1 DNA-binding transcriptional regulator, MarR family [Aneurinibacillus migulanus]